MYFTWVLDLMVVQKNYREEILSGLSQLDYEPEWCLPPKFWERAGSMSGYTATPLGNTVGLPYRQCHRSSFLVYLRGKSVPGCSLRVATGYAYSEGYWFRHTWVVNPPDKTLLECTPVIFEGYCGVILTHREALQFALLMEAHDFPVQH